MATCNSQNVRLEMRLVSTLSAEIVPVTLPRHLEFEYARLHAGF